MTNSRTTIQPYKEYQNPNVENVQKVSRSGKKLDNNILQKMDDNIEKQLQTQTKMFLTYLKNQTLDSSVNTQEMMQGMMTMMMAGQQLKTNKLLSENNKLQSQNLEFIKNQHIGKTVLHESNELYFDGQNPKEINFIMPAESTGGEIVIFDENSNPVRTLNLNSQPGRSRFFWDGKDEQSQIAKAGKFTIQGYFKDCNDTLNPLPLYTEVLIDELYHTDDGDRILMAGGLEIDIDSPKVLSERRSSFFKKTPILSPNVLQNNLLT